MPDSKAYAAVSERLRVSAYNASVEQAAKAFARALCATVQEILETLGFVQAGQRREHRLA